MIESRRRYYRAIMLSLALLSSKAADSAELRTLQAVPVDEPPVIDGIADDLAWRNARPIITKDTVADTSLTLAAVYTRKEVFFHVSFPDDAPNRAQKTYAWDAAAGRYRTGPKREDTCVLKWAMDADATDLTLSAEQSYKADIWYWKAARTNPVGFADDKFQVYSRGRMPQSKQVLSRMGEVFYLRRSGDTGHPAYQVISHPKFQGQTMPKYKLSTPTGSRADIRAKGVWSKGVWNVEFGRALHTDQPDDVQFDAEQSYLFGVSRYEIAGRKPNPALQQPLYGAGDITEHLWLIFHPAR